MKHKGLILVLILLIFLLDIPSLYTNEQSNNIDSIIPRDSGDIPHRMKQISSQQEQSISDVIEQIIVFVSELQFHEKIFMVLFLIVIINEIRNVRRREQVEIDEIAE